LDACLVGDWVMNKTIFALISVIMVFTILFSGCIFDFGGTEVKNDDSILLGFRPLSQTLIERV
jgi:hypothetical protein